MSCSFTHVEHNQGCSVRRVFICGHTLLGLGEEWHLVKARRRNEMCFGRENPLAQHANVNEQEIYLQILFFCWKGSRLRTFRHILQTFLETVCLNIVSWSSGASLCLSLSLCVSLSLLITEAFIKNTGKKIYETHCLGCWLRRSTSAEHSGKHSSRALI